MTIANTRSTIPAPGRSARAATAMLLVLASAPVSACDLDGLSHGYGPMSALFAGAHHYQSLNGLADEADQAEASEATDVATPSEAVDTPAPPPPPRRSFVAWAKAKPKPAAEAIAGDAPATWAQSVPTRSADASRAAPQRGDTEQGEQRQRPPSGGPVP